MILSALISAKCGKDAGRTLGTFRQVERFGQVVQIAGQGRDIAAGPEHGQRITAPRHWGEEGNGTPSIGELHRLTRFDASQQLACPLPELSHPQTSPCYL